MSYGVSRTNGDQLEFSVEKPASRNAANGARD
jgi:hypothetical protein